MGFFIASAFYGSSGGIMETLHLDFNPENIALAGELIRSGRLVAFPTETVYGLGANALDEAAVRRIYEAKGRPSDNPLIVHISDFGDADGIAYVSDRAKTVMKAFMPGSLTVVLPKKDVIKDCVTGGLPTVAVRMPSSAQAREFLKACKVPVAAPSANTSRRPSPTDWQTVAEDMDGRIAAILKGENCAVGIESTVLDLVGEHPVIYRPGVVTAADIKEKTGLDVKYLPGGADLRKVNSPGLRYRHYAPTKPMYICRSGNVEKLRKTASRIFGGKKIALIAQTDYLGCIDVDCVFDLGDTPEKAMSRLFTFLRQAEKKADVIIAVYTDGSERSLGFNNRIMKSCGGNIIAD